MSSPLRKQLDEQGVIENNAAQMRLFAQNDRTDSVKLGSSPN